MSSTSEKTFELLKEVNYEEVVPKLAGCFKTMFAMGGTLACELANKATRKQQDRAQEHGEVAGERMLNHKKTPTSNHKMIPNSSYNLWKMKENYVHHFRPAPFVHCVVSV